MLLLVSLVAVVGLAKKLSPTIEYAVESANAPRAVVGIVVAALDPPARSMGRGSCRPGRSSFKPA